MAALWIDGILLTPVYFGIAFALGTSLWSDDLERVTAVGITTLVTVFLLEHLFLVGLGATPGKLALGIWVGTEMGERVTAKHALIRDLVASVFFIDILFPSAGVGIGAIVGLISIVMAIADKDRQSLHDRAAGTKVFRGKAPAKTLEVREYFPRL